jgi:pyruvate dehydrogenase E1 component alpha subunit
MVAGAEPRMTTAMLLEALRWMLLSRAYDERAIAMQRQGLYGVFSPTLGQEASVVGSSMALDPSRDWIVPQYRELMAVVRHGYPLERLAAIGIGRGSAATRIPEGVNVLPTQVALAAQLPHATGLAWGMKLQKKDGVVMTYVGDGGSSEGDFHEALNLAGVQRAPVVFFLQNNQWAISTPRRIQTATPSFALRAAGYGFPGVEVDGNDVMAVYEVASHAVERARAGDGPTLVESVTYRMSFHNTTDNPSLYEDPTAREEARLRDPIDRLVKYLRRQGLWDEATESQTRAGVRAEIEAAFAKAAGFPMVTPADLFEHVFAEASDHMRAQRDDLSRQGGQA